MAASTIGSDIFTMKNKLSKLSQLAQSKSLFQDPKVEIDELTYIINQDLKALKAKLGGLQGAIAHSKCVAHSKSVFESLGTQLEDAAQEFKDVLHTRTYNMQHMHSLIEQISASGRSAPPGGGGGGGGGGSGGSGAHDAAASTASGSDGTGFGGTSSGGMHCRRPAAPPPSIFELCAPPSACGDHKKNDDVGGGVGGGAGGFLGGGAGGGSGGGAGGGLGAAWASPAAKPAGLQTQGNGEVVIDLEVMSGAMAEQQQEYLPMGSAYLGERGRAIDTIQSTMAELGDIFQQLATMVQQQGERLQRVDDDLDDAQSNLRSGHAELQKYLRGLRSSRGLMIKIFIILFATIVLWGVLFA